MTYRRTLPGLIALLALATVALSACGGGSTIAEPKPLTQLPVQGFAMKTVWRTNAGDGGGEYDSGFVPAVADNRVFVANRNGEVVALSLDNGRRIWRSDTDDQLIAGPSVANGTLLMGTRDGHVVALSAATGKPLWTADLSSEVIAAPAANDQEAIARTVDGHVAALDLASGDRLWTIEGTVPNLTMRGTSSPLIEGDVVYIGMDSGKVLALDVATGEQRWSQTVALPEGRSELDRIVDVDADPLVTGNAIYAVSAGGKIVALSRNGGQIGWKHDLASVDNLAQDDSNVYATDMNSVVWAIDRYTGNPSWKQNALEYRRMSAPAVYDGDIVVGDYEGYLHFLSAKNGTIIARGQPFGEAIHAQPVVAGDDLIVLGEDGEVADVRLVGADSQ